jgi:hypothetical protein
VHALLRRGRPRKRWRYVGVFGEQLMACAAQVRIGLAAQSFWALALPEGELRERTRLVPRRSELTLIGGERSEDGSPGTGLLVICDRGVFLDLALEEQQGIEALCPNGDCEVWTRKQAGVGARGTLALDGGEPSPVGALAVIDDTAGHHARVTEWRWSAGVGSAPDGTPLAWNLVEGVNDPAVGSERAVWVDGVPHEVGPVRFAPDLSTIRGEDGAELRFEAQAERSRRENLLLVSSDYRAPFGSFTGTLPGGVALAHGLGVVEHHRARW